MDYRFLVGLLIGWNLICFLLMAVDKQRAREGRWRIKEFTLMVCSIFFGAVGIYCGMKVFHHKTRHLKFVVGVPLLVVVNLFSLTVLGKILKLC
ncbi:MAG TPA: DUF1294 domain-containing protein [Bacillota bacterium]|nr:DUF1294 domain-containing protein [Bacillota bacterium]HOL11228.1 DUF1294 domain-containing protein [Bacillota bacterium]HPO98936.1 DUF1294 domain-containing protein [Bacillota bacterium]